MHRQNGTWRSAPAGIGHAWCRVERAPRLTRTAPLMSTFSSASEADVARLSVVVPVRPNTPAVAACLTALTASDIPRCEWELIVVTSARDEDAWLVGALHADTVVRLPDGAWSAAYARNRGVEVSKGPYLVFVSADVCVEPDALRRFAAVLDGEPEVGAVCGTYVD